MKPGAGMNLADREALDPPHPPDLRPVLYADHTLSSLGPTGRREGQDPAGCPPDPRARWVTSIGAGGSLFTWRHKLKMGRAEGFGGAANPLALNRTENSRPIMCVRRCSRAPSCRRECVSAAPPTRCRRRNLGHDGAAFSWLWRAEPSRSCSPRLRRPTSAPSRASLRSSSSASRRRLPRFGRTGSSNTSPSFVATSTRAAPTLITGSSTRRRAAAAMTCASSTWRLLRAGSTLAAASTPSTFAPRVCPREPYTRTGSSRATSRARPKVALRRSVHADHAAITARRRRSGDGEGSGSNKRRTVRRGRRRCA
jgi:hypothetical protein